jgi:hypothetical protein
MLGEGENGDSETNLLNIEPDVPVKVTFLGNQLPNRRIHSQLTVPLLAICDRQWSKSLSPLRQKLQFLALIKPFSKSRRGLPSNAQSSRRGGPVSLLDCDNATNSINII